MKDSKWSAAHFRAVSLLLLTCALSNDSHAAPGDVDLSFDPDSGVNGPVNAIVAQPNGKLLIGGSFTARIARLNGDGSADNTFNAGTNFPGSAVQDIALQPDGKILVMVDNFRLLRLNATGISDTQFRADIGDHFTPIDYTTILALALQPDGKILVAGYTTHYVIDPDCPYYPNCYEDFYTAYFVVRLQSGGSRDTSFSAGLGGPAYAIALRADGKVIIGGSFATVNGTNRNAIARLNANGGLDSTFNPGTGANGIVSSVALQPEGQVLIGGSFTSVNGTNCQGIARLNANGSLDSSFNPRTGVSGTVSSVALQPDGKVLIGGSFTNVNNTNRNNIARLNANGSLDGSFNPGTGANGSVLSVASQSDGKVLIGGNFTTVNGVWRSRVARLYGDFIPSLSIGRSNAFLIISWPVTGLNLQLQENTDLSLTNSWSPVTQPAGTNAGQISLTVSATAPRNFFRLSSP